MSARRFLMRSIKSRRKRYAACDDEIARFELAKRVACDTLRVY